MTTGILSAMAQEQAGLGERLDEVRIERYAGREFHVGRWHGREVVLALSRIGKVAAATTAAALIERFGVSRIVFTGVAGGLHPSVRVGDTVVGTEFVQHDMDASPIFPRHEVPLYGRSRFPADAELTGWLAQAAQAVLDDSDLIDETTRQRFGLLQPQRLHHGLIASGDRFVSGAAESAALRASLPEAMAVEMEAAAVAQVCFDHGLAFAAVRNISDRADDTAHVDFDAYIQEVAGIQARALIAALLPLLPP
ncbi:5'-methylthioadenosine/adenosylhomocysteine nucleosidase [Variovorax sp. OV329]|uniref:5'-methylthioadenosine/adenosylhomocysteine nucleosidase n=1 Tax=Variovorax sp. OV329 TaxID=1882825 RepID=UPI0008EFF7CD|nr:5'-methylthioadenosine/adenosylhomocysteine nucleosidase [Variovorax sp. OV329]SFM83852.1 adenosylhomocysteine nucleosidase [Variovorax sp. OV329]